MIAPNSQRSRIVNNTLTLNELFNNRIFRVPDYQRGYAWENQQVGEFLEDLEILSSSRHHYTGTIVLHKRDDAKEIDDNEGTPYIEMDVVDGQQRLTTIILLLNEISRELEACQNSHDLGQGIRKNYVEGTDLDGQPLHKLSLNGDTDHFFKTGVLPKSQGVEAPTTASARRLLQAKRQISDYLRKGNGDTPNHEEWLRDLRGKVTGGLYFNLYEVEYAAEVGIIFEVMNDRGKPLTDLEKVKNYLLYVASTLDVKQNNRDKLANDVNNAWGEVLERLMAAGLSSSADEDQLLRAHWLMQYDPQSRNWHGSRSVKTQFDLRKYRGQHDQMLSALSEYVMGLRAASVCYCDALRPTRDEAFKPFDSMSKIRGEVKFWNSKLVRIGITATFLPLLMAVRTRWPGDPQRYLEVSKLCEAVAFRFYRVGGFYSSYSQPRMFRLAYRVAHGMNFDDAIREIKQSYNDWQERKSFEDFTDIDTPRPWYGGYGERYLRYFLYEYEEYLASVKGAPPIIKWDEARQSSLADSIEHILPQSIENRPYWNERFDADTHQKYVHDIGNLTLTKHNSYYGVKPFPEKKGSLDSKSHCYMTAPFFQEREVAQYEDWTTDAIDKRRATLLEWAKERWGIDFGDAGVSADTIEPDDEEEDYDGE